MARKRKPPKCPAHIQSAKRSGDRWVYRGRVHVGKNHKQVTGAWRDSIQEALGDLEELHKRKEQRPAKLLVLAEAMKAVLARCVAKGRRAPTIENYRKRFVVISKDFPADMPLHRLTAETVEAWARLRVERDKVAWGTVRSDLRTLNLCFGVAGQPSPIKMVMGNLPDPNDPEVDWFAPKELKGVLRKMRRTKGSPRLLPERDANVVEFLALTGLRLREASLLVVGDVSLPKKTITVRHDVGKCGRRTIQLGPVNAKLVAYFLAGRDRFPARRGDTLLPVSYEGTKTMLRRWSERLGEPRLHAHALRHTFGTTLALNGHSDRQVMAAMGHRTTYMLTKYCHLTGADVGDAVAAMNFRTA